MTKRLLAVLFAGALFLGACSDDKTPVATDGTDDTGTTEAPDTTGAPETTVTTETTETTETTDTTAPGGLDAAEVQTGVEDALAESLGGLTGSGSEDDLGLDDEATACVVAAVLDDEDLAATLLAADADPDYIPSGTDMAALFGIMGDCDLGSEIAASMVEPGLDQEQAECFVEGLFGVSPETWDAIFAMDADPTATPDLSVMQDFLALFSDCGIDPTALS